MEFNIKETLKKHPDNWTKEEIAYWFKCETGLNVPVEYDHRASLQYAFENWLEKLKMYYHNDQLQAKLDEAIALNKEKGLSLLKVCDDCGKEKFKTDFNICRKCIAQLQFNLDKAVEKIKTAISNYKPINKDIIKYLDNLITRDEFNETHSELIGIFNDLEIYISPVESEDSNEKAD